MEFYTSGEKNEQLSQEIIVGSGDLESKKMAKEYSEKYTYNIGLDSPKFEHDTLRGNLVFEPLISDL